MAEGQSMNTHVSKWFRIENLEEFLDILKLGDIIEVEMKSGNHHFGIYIGHENLNGLKRPFIAHCDPRTNCCELPLPGSSVFNALLGTQSVCVEDIHPVNKTSIDCLIQGACNICITNDLVEDWEPYPAEEILSRALSQCSERDPDARLSFTSCKHFVLWCCYDENYINSIMETTQKKASNIKTFVGAVGAAAAAAGLGYLAYSWNKKEKRKRQTNTENSET